MGSILIWFRRDLRLTDNPALQAALAHGDPVIPIYIHAPEEEARWPPGAASLWWLHHSLHGLDADLRGIGSRLVIRRGPSLAALRGLVAETGADRVVWNRLYEPALVARDRHIKSALRDEGLACESHNAALLREPWTVQTGDGAPYRVFSAYWRTCLRGLTPPQPPAPPPRSLPPVSPAIGSDPLATLGLLPRIPWDQGLASSWNPGEQGAAERLDAFLGDPLSRYPLERDLPERAGTSALSPHLHFGEIGPRQLRWALATGTMDGRPASNGAEAWLRQLGWREFAHHLLYHFPRTAEHPLDTRFDGIPWRDTPAELAAWQQGATGIPLVDAGMRELWHTGFMHNRVRMVVASLLTKNLGIHWLEGARWFWDTLVDADLANNTLGWQWTAGCGADAAPYFRVFNPVRQGERFDAQGRYVRRWLPELARLPVRWIHQPWAAPAAALQESGVRLGADYPEPVLDLAASRVRALENWDLIRQLR